MSTDHEKKSELFRVTTVTDDQEILKAETRQIAERQLVRKLDSRLLLTVFVIYFFNYIDRVSITSARLKNLQADLGLSDIQYDTVIAILYVSYSPAQIPSNIAINYVSRPVASLFFFYQIAREGLPTIVLRPSLYIGTCVVLWGLTSAFSGLTHNFAGIMACRVFIGFPEAAFYPGAVYLLSRWYTRKELTFRTTILFTAMLVANAFGSLWAAAILGSMNGIMGIAAWRWLFYIQGAATIFVGFVAMWLLSDYPHNTRWLTPKERRLAQIRLAEDAGEADMDSQQASLFEGLKLALKDPKVPLFMFMGFSMSLGASFALFLPTLAATLGYSTTITLLIIAPPWIYSVIVSLINAWHADITGERFFHLSPWLWIAIVGYIISLSTMKTAGRYISVFLMTSASCASPLILVWTANVIPRPPAKRSAAIALVNGTSSLGSVLGSYIWRANWGPEYHQSMIICLSAFGFGSFIAFIMRVLLMRENKRMEHAELNLMHGPERERIEEAAKLEGITFDEAVRHRKGFRYLY